MSCIRRVTTSSLRTALRGSPTLACLPAAGRQPIRRSLVRAAGAGFTTAALVQAHRINRLHCREPSSTTGAPPTGGPASGKDEPAGIDPLADQIATMVTNALMKLGFAGVMGFCAGVALKRASTEAAYTLGCAFIFLQGLAWRGYIEMKWAKIRTDLVALVDTDGDGQITRSDVMRYVKKGFSILVYQLPSTSGFSLGLMWGFNWA